MLGLQPSLRPSYVTSRPVAGELARARCEVFGQFRPRRVIEMEPDDLCHLGEEGPQPGVRTLLLRSAAAGDDQFHGRV
jgi:hypothetical protein